MPCGAHAVRAVQLLLLAVPLFWLAPTSLGAQETLVGTASVIDGDTIEIHGTRIRLHGIDAPESAQLCTHTSGQQWRCGQQSALALSDHIGHATVACQPTDTDRYGRTVAVCFAGDNDLNAWMVTEGWAVAYRTYSSDYVAAEDGARATGAGIWSSQFVMPWDWRRGMRVIQQDDVNVHAEGCDIKGNINRDGKMIYHVPGGRWYEQTRIDESAGERWFCSEVEAQEAGWRRSRE